MCMYDVVCEISLVGPVASDQSKNKNAMCMYLSLIVCVAYIFVCASMLIRIRISQYQLHWMDNNRKFCHHCER